ncbi:alpha/beta hydrolase family protein [Acidobacteriota bacterium]
MNIHSLIDQISIKGTEVLVINNKIFSKGIKSPAYVKQLQDIRLNIPEIDGEGIYEVEAETAAGPMDPAFLIHQWKGGKYPSIIYHHGNLERPFNFHWYMKNTFRDIFTSYKKPIEANLIAIRAPYHRGSILKYAKHIGYLTNFIAMLSVSAKLIDFLVDYLRSEGSGQVIVSGVSLGGLAANLHRTYFNTADVYIPLCAGASLGDVFLTSAYKKVAKIVHEHRDTVHNVLDFEMDFKKNKSDNVFPLLARYDQLFRYERQRESYDGHPVTVLDKGHWTGSLSSKQLRKHIFAYINSKS